MLMEMARWPDDIRGGLYDHATWHYSGRALSDTKQPPAQARRPEIAGAALEALALNAVVVADSSASQGERAVALCWLFHLVGDIHQPLHAADQVSATLPNGDRGGGSQFLLDPETRQPVTLHQFWDGAVHGSPEGTSAIGRARELRTKYPRSAFPELAKKPEGVRDFAAWAKESYDLARTMAYGPDLKTSAVDTTAPDAVRQVRQRRDYRRRATSDAGRVSVDRSAESVVGAVVKCAGSDSLSLLTIHSSRLTPTRADAAQSSRCAHSSPGAVAIAQVSRWRRRGTSHLAADCSRRIGIISEICCGEHRVFECARRIERPERRPQ